ncbi:MAG: hypothetical protein ACPKOI_04985 [Pleomorphochaeta sp.]
MATKKIKIAIFLYNFLFSWFMFNVFLLLNNIILYHKEDTNNAIVGNKSPKNIGPGIFGIKQLNIVKIYPTNIIIINKYLLLNKYSLMFNKIGNLTPYSPVIKRSPV